MQLVSWREPKASGPLIAGTTRDWKQRFEQTAQAPNWLAAHSWNVDLRTMQEVAGEVREKLQLSPEDRLLDVGCGTGGFLSLLLHPGQHGYGFDLSEALLQRGIEGDLTCNRIHCGAADGAKLPLASESFDKIVCYGVLQCLPDQAAAARLVRELIRVCKPGGIIFVGDVSGILEKHRRRLSDFGFRERTIDAVLAAASPFWRLRHRWKHESPSHLYLQRGLFRSAVGRMPCELHFRTFGVRPNSRCRFDVIIQKHDSEAVEPSTPAPHRESDAIPVFLQRFDSFEQLLPFRSQWNALAEQARADLFASFDWCSTWWKHFQHGRKAELFVARSEIGDIVGFLPLFRETVGFGPWSIRVVRMVGSCAASTRCDLAVRPEYIRPFFREAARYLDESGPWDLIHIGDLPGSFAHGRALARALQCGLRRSRVIHRTGYYPNSIFDIPPSYEEYLNRLSQNERGSIRRTERRLIDEQQAVIRNTTLNELDECFRQFHHQHEAWWAPKGRLGYFRDWPGSLAFHREFSEIQAREGRLHLLRLEAGGESIGFHYCHRFGTRIHWFSSSRAVDSKWDAYSVGRQLHCAMVREAMNHGVTEIDGMNGYYEHKRRWGARYTHLQNITAVSQDAWSRLALRDFQSASRLHFLGHRLWFWHVAPWLRRKFPRIGASWLQKGQTQTFVRTRFMEYASADQADDAVCYSRARQCQVGNKT